ncbi:CAMP-dependent protein kinase regulatory subunit, putative [Eimeria maxima]|uniref:cAMP-dependent protein kinase regulatory subunit n=1 Tax=Eimeria maxima TaxID=5804 RepID=U6LYP4_EIMMA|nr:CAMP-dependent protein kinase regulatory subunit, putative [Eimeria maxima]CDJ57052.1 CAMP-dependent protein kinase regulatory subunit, putative [Eimeria maxima]
MNSTGGGERGGGGGIGGGGGGGGGGGEYEEYIQLKLSPILEKIVTEILLAMPADPIPFMISKLCIIANLPDPYLQSQQTKETEELREELARLRQEVQAAMQQQKQQQQQQQQQSSSGGGGGGGSSQQQQQQQRQVAFDSSSSNRSTQDTDDSEEEEEEEEEGEEEGGGEEEEEIKIDKIRGFNKMRQSVCAEVYGNWNKKQQFEPPVYPKTEEQKKRLHEILGISFMFSSLGEKELRVVIDAMRERNIPEQMTLIKQGQDGDCLYVVEKGQLECWREEEGGKEIKMVKSVGPGDVFGELALLYNSPRAATVKSVNSCSLWRLDRDVFNAIVKDAAKQKRDMYDAFLAKVRLLESMSAYDRLKLADALRTEEFNDGEYIVKQGEPGDIFYLIEEGSAIVLKVFDGQTESQEIGTYTNCGF